MLAELPMLVNQKRLADVLGVEPRTLRVWIRKGCLPPPTRLNRKVLFWTRDVVVEISQTGPQAPGTFPADNLPAFLDRQRRAEDLLVRIENTLAQAGHQVELLRELAATHREDLGLPEPPAEALGELAALPPPVDPPISGGAKVT